jgi:predicted glycosyltransferase
MAARWGRARSRPRRALYLSSPIGLGHARRDLAIAQALRELAPDLEVDWLAQHPVTRVLEAAGERVHPASRLLASESAHFQDEAADHDLNAFQALRRMDEILVANFMLFHEVIADGAYDLVVGDEAWDVDYFWHENPELKRTAFCWMTDFVGFVPMPEDGEAEALLTTDYNAEMIEQVARFPRVRDLAVFVGDPDDIAPVDFGPGLPRVRAWVEQHYGFAGYVGGFDPAALGDRQELRERLGYRPEEQIVVVTVGGSGVGGALLRRVVAAYPEAARRVDGLRMVAVAGPRIDPGSLQAPAGVEVLGYVADLQRHLAACDLAVVQGGLSTCMELSPAVACSCTSPCATTSSRTSTSPTGWTATTPAGGWTTPPPPPRRSPPPSPRSSTARSTTARSRPTAPPAPPPSSPSCCRGCQPAGAASPR